MPPQKILIRTKPARATSWHVRLAVLGLAVVARIAAAQAPTPVLSPTAVRALVEKYRLEKESTEHASAGRLSQELFEQADRKAKEAEGFLKAGRLQEAREAAREALWSLPVLSPDLPEHVA